MADAQFAMLLSMGYQKQYIERALDVHKKSKYGENWNLNILVEIIGRLEEKDTQLNNHVYSNYMQQPAPQLQQSHSANDKPYYGYLGGDHSYRDGLSSSSEDRERASQPPQQLREEPFIPHYASIEEPLKLRVNDLVDYRYENGRYLLCKIIAKSAQLNNMMLLHPVGKPIYDTKYDRLVDIYSEYFKISLAKSICLRKIKSSKHIFYHLKVNDYVDINPFYQLNNNGWVNAKIIKLDPNSSQIKVIYHNEKDGKNYSFWVHLSNSLEVSEFRSKCNSLDQHQVLLENKNIITATHSKMTMTNISDDNNYTNHAICVRDLKEEMKEEKEKEKEMNIKEEDIIEIDGDILSKSLDIENVSDNDICRYLLEYDTVKWEFNHNNARVEVYRLMINRVNHTSMLPHPVTIRFPQYFSSMKIPNKTQFICHVLPPKSSNCVRVSIKQWRVRILINETTTKELINKIVGKYKNSFEKTDFDKTYNSEEFILKVVGCEEYILYDENKMIISYESVRKAVRNENNVKFQLVYIPSFKAIERECFNKNMRTMSSFKTKYMDSHLLTPKIMSKHTLQFCPYSFGDGAADLSNPSANEEKEDKDSDLFVIPMSDFANEHIYESLPLPSMKDTQHLLSQSDSELTLFHEFEQYYNLKIFHLLNVTQLPLYKHYTSKKGTKKKWNVVIRHELWIGNLRYDECAFDTKLLDKVSDGMRFNQSFESTKYKYCDLARESCISLTVFLCNEDPKQKDIPIAFVRLPIIDVENKLLKGKYSLNLWPIPLYINYYKGPKCDAYENLNFRYCGTTVDRYLKKGETNYKITIEVSVKEEKSVVALPFNYRCPYQKNNYKIHDKLECEKIISYDLLHEYNSEEKQIVWQHRDHLLSKGQINCLTSLIRCIDFRDKYQRSELYDYIDQWSNESTESNEDLLELLSYEFMDNYVREMVIMRLSNAMTDNDIIIFLLQLVQVLKYELHHNNALIRFVMRRSLQNPYQVGHYFFWHIKSEYLDNNSLNLMYLERFGLYLEEYLLYSQCNISRNILIQSKLSKALMYINNKLRKLKKMSKGKGKNVNLKAILCADLQKLNRILPADGFILPIQPKWHCKSIVIDECKMMSSAQLPLWLSFSNVDTSAENTVMMFKAGDDLRQDILTLSMIRVLDKIWLETGSNLNLLPYNVICTGYGQGMVEIVLNARTTTHIHTHYGGGAQKGARDISTHLKYLCDVNNNNTEMINKARDIYTRSCAGYCITSYVLGLGDRHPSNIMVRTKGELFHIDFSHFLGNFKSQKVIGDYVKWQREVAPFVFLPANKYCIENGNENYKIFIKYCVDAYLQVRQRHKLLINLFILMLPSQMPELIKKEHINYLRDQLHLGDIRTMDEVHKHILKIMNICLNDKRRVMDNMIHAMVHQ